MNKIPLIITIFTLMSSFNFPSTGIKLPYKEMFWIMIIMGLMERVLLL